ncbi:MAG: BrnA antitoxin family protein [Chloroflexota bacterium]|nr:BrnA antitoxin family protein [Chloroflexota bacterium]
MAKLPEFKSEEEEAEFWDTHDSTEYFEDMPEVDIRFVFTQPRAVPVHLAGAPWIQLQLLAIAQGMTPQTLLQQWVLERLAHEPAVAALPAEAASVQAG